MTAVDFISAYSRFPSVSTDPAFSEGMKGAREFFESSLRTLGFAVETVRTPLHPIVLAERKGPSEDCPHVIIYSHYDVQPADPLNLWKTPAFEPQIRDGRLYARGAADNKGPTGVQWTALRNVLERFPDLPLHVTWLIEGEEEMGSPSLPGFLQQYASRLAKADLILMSDSGSPSQEQIVITTGLRGLVGLEVELTGPRVDLHSGIHGGAVYNPIQALVEVCASLHHADGSVAVPGFYDDVVPPADWERSELLKLKTSLSDYKTFLGVPAFHTAPGLNAFEAVRFAPTLEFNGIGGGYQGTGSKTVIPSRAFAKITCRLVANQNPAVITQRVRSAIESRLPAGVTAKVTVSQGGHPYLVVPPGRPNTPADQPSLLQHAFRSAEASVQAAFGTPPLFLREGGSVPIIADLKARTGLDTVMIGLFTPEDNLHAPNESMPLNMIERGVRLYEGLFERLAGVSR